jgi:hypothetical protein
MQCHRRREGAGPVAPNQNRHLVTAEDLFKIATVCEDLELVVQSGEHGGDIGNRRNEAETVDDSRHLSHSYEE